MARELSIIMIFLVAMLLLHIENAEIVVTTIEAPAPQPNNSTNHFPNNVGHVAHRDAQKHSTRSHACSSAKSVVPSVYVFLLELMATSKFVLAITTGRPKEEDPNAPEFSYFLYQVS
ncbi:hypothetical protein Lal_00023022 [Lupinus albus]|nr:hypothetical protein Lal_00023022 [Lupinus albus]